MFYKQTGVAYDAEQPAGKAGCLVSLKLFPLVKGVDVSSEC
jgi:hypothetical protein